MKAYTFVALIIGLLFLSCSTGREATAAASFYEFNESQKLSAVLDQAVGRDKLVFIDFHASWCLPCKIMDEQIDRDPQLKRALKEDFIIYKVDGEAGFGKDLMVIYNVSAFPTFLFLDQAGNVLIRQEGTASNQQIYEFSRESIRLAN